MKEEMKNPSGTKDDSMKIIVSKNGPHIVTGGVPQIISEICNDDEGYCRTWLEVKETPMQANDKATEIDPQPCRSLIQ